MADGLFVLHRDVVRATMFACPCCGHVTLSDVGGFETCEVCYWNDDGQNDVDAHVENGGPNHETLWEARTAFLKLGASDPDSVDHVRKPRANEPRMRRWELLDGRAVEPIDPTSLSPWRLVLGARINRVSRRGTCVFVTIELPSEWDLSVLGSDKVMFVLVGCLLADFREPGSDPVQARDVIEDAAVLMNDVRSENGAVCVSLEHGEVVMRYAYLTVLLPSGLSLAFAALERAAGLPVWGRRGRPRPNA